MVKTMKRLRLRYKSFGVLVAVWILTGFYSRRSFPTVALETTITTVPIPIARVEQQDTPHHDTNDNDIDRNGQEEEEDNDTFVCAPWLPASKRNVVLFSETRFHDAQQYYAGTGYLGGEAYWTASLSMVLHELNFSVRVEQSNPWQVTAEEQSTIHRVIVDVPQTSLFDPSILHTSNSAFTCKLRVLHWWDNHELFDLADPRNKWRRDPSCYLLPFPRNPNVTSPVIPFLLHAQDLTLKTLLKDKKTKQTPWWKRRTTLWWWLFFRNKPPKPNVFLLSKTCAFLDTTLIDELQRLPIQLHATCFGKRIEVPKSIINHGRLTPIEFHAQLQQMHVLIGFGTPYDSPTPFDGISHGVSFLNPTRGDHHSQHQPLRTMMLGPPYVYNYEYLDQDMVQTNQNLLQALQLALQDRAQQQISPKPPNTPLEVPRLSGYIPPEYRMEYLKRHVCQELIEEDRLCSSHTPCLTMANWNATKCTISIHC
jgi:hypothetical protein